MQPQYPTHPPGPFDANGILPKEDGGLGIDASKLVWGVVSYNRGILYPFGAGTWFPAHVAYSPTNYLDSDTTQSLRYPWPASHRYVGVLEVQIDAAVGDDEDFEVQVHGVVYPGSGLITASTIAPLDGSAATKITFNAGDTATKRVTTFLLATIGGVPITHVLPGVTPLGGSLYQGQVSMFVHCAP